MQYKMQNIPLLPVDIQDEILQHCSFHERWQLAAVNQAFRFMILNGSLVWSHLSTKHNSIVPDLLPYIAYIKTSSVKSICVEAGNMTHWTNVLNFIKIRHFYAIAQVELNIPCFTTDQLSTLTDTCGEVLTNIKLTVRQRDPYNVRPDQVIRQCPNLITFHFTGWISNPTAWKPDFPTEFKHPILSELLLDFYNRDEERFFDLQSFLQATPNLQRLCIDDKDTIHIELLPQLLIQYSVKLLTLILYDSKSGDNTDLPTVLVQTTTTTYGNKDSCMTDNTTTTKKEDTPSLRHLIIRSIDNNTDMIPGILILQLLEYFSNQLVLFDYTGGTFGSNLERLSQLQFSSLKHLKVNLHQQWSFDAAGDDQYALFCLFLSHATPQLSSLTLKHIPGVDDVMLDTLFPNNETDYHVQELAIEYCVGITEKGLIQLFERIGSQLQKLVLRIKITPKILNAIANALDHLKKLTMDLDLSVPQLELFLRNCQYMEDDDDDDNNNYDESIKRYTKLDITHHSSEIMQKEKCDPSTIDHLIRVMDKSAKQWKYLLQWQDWMEPTCHNNSNHQYCNCMNYNRYREYTHIEFRKERK